MGLFDKTPDKLYRPAPENTLRRQADKYIYENKVPLRDISPKAKTRGQKEADVARAMEERNLAVQEQIKASRDVGAVLQSDEARKKAAVQRRDEEARKAGISDEDLAKSFWEPEMPLTQTSFTDLTGRKIAKPSSLPVGSVTERRDIMLPDGGMLRQYAGPNASGSATFTKDQVIAMREREAKDADYQENMAKAKEFGANWGTLARASRTANKLESLGVDTVPLKGGGSVNIEDIKGILSMGAKELNDSPEAIKTLRSLDLTKAGGEASRATFAKWEEDKRAYQRGLDLQSQGRRRLVQINRALKGAPQFTTRGRGSNYGDISTSDQFLDLLDEKAYWEDVVGKKEGLGDKQVTQLGLTSEANRARALEERKILRDAALRAAESSATSAESMRKIMEANAPLSAFMYNFYNTMIGNKEAWANPMPSALNPPTTP